MGRTLRSSRGLCAAVAVLACLAALVPAAASAAALANPPGFAISVTESASTMTYGEATPSFRASLTTPPDDVIPPTAANNFFLLVDGQQNQEVHVGGTSPFSLSFTSLAGPPLPVGQHSVSVEYSSTKYGLVTSAPVTLVVVKSTPVLQCGISPSLQTYAPGTAITISTGFVNVNSTVDWQNGTFTITFSGSQTFTMGGLVANSSGVLSTVMPSVPDSYLTTCSFNGTASYNAVQFRFGSPLIVSTGHAIGGIRLSTDPPDLRSDVTMTWNVVVLPGPGLPAPTGNFNIRIGAQLLQIVALGSGGSVTFQTTPPALAFSGSSIRVWYFGDAVYAPSSADFSLSSPAQSGASAPGPGATGPGATAVPGLQAAATAPGAPTGTPTEPAVAGNQALAAQPSQASGPSARTVTARLTSGLVTNGAGHLGWLVGSVAFVVLIAIAAVGLVVWRHRTPA